MKIFRNLPLAIVVYLFYGAIIYFGPVPSYLGTDLTMDSGRDRLLLLPMQDTFQNEAATILLVSFACFLVWYFVAEHVIRIDPPASNFYALWWPLLVVILIVAGFEFYQAIMHLGSSLLYNRGEVAAFYFILGVLFFWIATAFFSPPNAEYAIWPAKLVRKK